MAISVEVGPLRGRKGHGLQLYYTDEEGTRHPIGFGGEHQDPELAVADGRARTDERSREAARVVRRGGQRALVRRVSLF